MENFQDYIYILKILKNSCVQNGEFSELVWKSFVKFVEKPSLFNNLTELFEVDELHTSLFTKLFKLGDRTVRFEADYEIRDKTMYSPLIYDISIDFNEIKKINSFFAISDPC